MLSVSNKGNTMESKKPTLWDYLGACIFGAILGAFMAYGLLGGTL